MVFLLPEAVFSLTSLTSYMNRPEKSILLTAFQGILQKIYKKNALKAVTFSAMEHAVSLFRKATFVMDCCYDDNKIFLKLDSVKQDYIIRLTAKRKLLYHNKWGFATELHNRRKSKVKTSHVLQKENARSLPFPCESTDYSFWKR